MRYNDQNPEDTTEKKLALHVNAVSKVYRRYQRPIDRIIEYFHNKASAWMGRPRISLHEEFTALDQISVSVLKGETLGIIGKNGSGKSTLLQLICGTMQPSSGEIKTSGRIAALLELGSGFNPEFTGRENIYLNASVLGLSEKEVSERIDEIIEFAEIGDFIDRPVKTYSSGMFVRLAFAVIAHVDADILIIDEALSVGDVFFVQKCMRFLRKFMQNNTVIFVSHDIGAVMNLCTRAILLQDGRVMLNGNPKVVVDHYLALLNSTNNDLNEMPMEEHQSSVEDMGSGSLQLLNDDAQDCRQELISRPPFRNDIKVMDFDGGKQFGAGGANIDKVFLQSSLDEPIVTAIGGEMCQLVIEGTASQKIDQAIVGFMVRDRLGQNLFGDNSFLRFASNPIQINKGSRFRGRFVFRMPILPTGEYTVSVALAEGTQEHHVQHHWLNDALVLTSVTSSVSTGLVGIPMLDIHLEECEAAK